MRFNNSKSILVFCMITFVLFSFTNDRVQKKKIRNKNFDIQFYVSLRNKKTTKDKTYYWYKSGDIHNSFGDSGGELLHQEYIKHYAGNAIAEKGKFRYGLKIGTWKKWHSNGLLKEQIIWNNGERNGKYYGYSESGLLVLKGKYKNNKRHAVWVEYPAEDTTWYFKGEAFNENPKTIKRRLDSLKEINRLKKRQDTTQKSFFKKIFSWKKHNGNKNSFFKRLFSKNRDSIKSN